MITCKGFISLCGKILGIGNISSCQKNTKRRLNKMSDKPITLKKLQKFIKIRNKSEFDTNFAFAADCDLADFTVSELGPAKKLPHFSESIPSYYWITPFGILVERYYQLRLFKYMEIE
jgi:hypothetical protein